MLGKVGRAVQELAVSGPKPLSLIGAHYIIQVKFIF